MIKTIRVYAKEVERGGKQFMVYSAWKELNEGIDPLYYDVKFRKECAMSPKTKGYWLITFDTMDASLEKRKEYHDVLWVKKVIEMHEDVEYLEQRKQMHQNDLNDFLG